jgi:hypothetical protein
VKLSDESPVGDENQTSQLCPLAIAAIGKPFMIASFVLVVVQKDPVIYNLWVNGWFMSLESVNRLDDYSPW